MADNTPLSLRSQVIYSVYLRNHTPSGTFRALIPDLPRIRSLGTDILWLMPIHPIGVKSRKGTLGSPYANMDYRTVNPEYGTMEDFIALADAVHAQGMKLMIDVVYNHTSPDSVLWNTHPEFFYKKPDGKPGNHVGDWSDIIDLDYTVPALWDYQIETLKFWAGYVDGYRCDVASFVPAAFWLRARKAVEEVHPGFIWLAESVHRSFAAACRQSGMAVERDIDLFSPFDMEYDYDTRDAFEGYLRGETSLGAWLDLVNFQEFVYPKNYDKMRFLENHDVPRIASFCRDERELRSFTAMLYFLPGTTLLYGGQEAESDHLPDLFNKDTVDFHTGKDLTPLLQVLARIKKEQLSPADSFLAKWDDRRDLAILYRFDGERKKLGLFSLRGQTGDVAVELPDGAYTDAITGRRVQINGGKLHTDGEPLILC